MRSGADDEIPEVSLLHSGLGGPSEWNPPSADDFHIFAFCSLVSSQLLAEQTYLLRDR
jgi:hypothetical protein